MFLSAARVFHGEEEAWDQTLGPRAADAWEVLRERMVVERDAASLTFDQAAAAQCEDVVRLVAAGAGYLEALCPDRRLLLRKLSVLSRMAGAMMPLPRLPTTRWRSPSLTALAGVGALLHAITVTVHERFRLRTSLMSVGFWVLARSFAGVQQRVAPETAAVELRRVLEARDDFATMDHETLEAARILIAALAA